MLSNKSSHLYIFYYSLTFNAVCIIIYAMTKKQTKTKNIKNIKINQETKRPIVVDVPESEFFDQPIEKADFIENVSSKSLRNQIAVEKILGVKKIDDSVGKRQKLYKRIVSAIFIIFMVGVFAYTAYQDFFVKKNFPSVSEIRSIFRVGWLFFLLAFLSLFLAFFFKGLKNSVMCKSMTGKFHFKTCLETSVIGTYYNNVTPLAVGGQPFEIYHLSKHGIHGGVASSIPIASFFLNQLTFVILGIVSLVLFSRNLYNAPSQLINAFDPAFFSLTIVGLFCCVFVPALVILFSMLPRVGAKLVWLVIKIGTKLRIVKKPQETLQATVKTVVHNAHCLKKIATRPLLFFSLLLFSFLENLANVSIAFFVLKGFGLEFKGINFALEWVIICSICFILYASITFIPTPGNSGAADLSFYLLFETVLFAGLAFPAMIIWRLFSFYSTIIIGFTFATIKKKSDNKNSKLVENKEKELSTE